MEYIAVSLTHLISSTLTVVCQLCIYRIFGRYVYRTRVTPIILLLLEYNDANTQ